jgi:thiol-disulfide isomerase/thioredoxin
MVIRVFNFLNYYYYFFSYAPWCPACQNLQPEWESFAEWGEDLEVNVAKVDVTEQTGTVNLVGSVCLPVLLIFIIFHIIWALPFIN